MYAQLRGVWTPVPLSRPPGPGATGAAASPPPPRSCSGLGPSYSTSLAMLSLCSQLEMSPPLGGRREAAVFVDRGCGSSAVRHAARLLHTQ